MMHAWPTGDLLLPGDWPAWAPKHILEKYEGPQLVVQERGGIDYLGIAVDEDATAIRWVFAPLGSLELKGLIHGGETLRAALLKERVFVVDCASDDLRPLHAMQLRGDQLPEAALPEPGALLPDSLKEKFPEPPPGLLPHFDLQSSLGTGVSFGDAAAMMSDLQFVWGSIAQGHNISSGRLVIAAGGGGSLRLYIDSDPGQFQRIAKIYRDIALAFDNPSRLAVAIQQNERVPIGAFSKYLSTIKRHRVDVLATWAEEAAFLGPDVAERAVRHVLPEALPIVRAAIALPPPLEPQPLTLHGYFENFWRSKRSGRFEFYDLDTAQSYVGTIAPRLIRQISAEEFTLVLGRATFQRYLAKVAIRFVTPEKQKIVLEHYEPIPKPHT